MIAEFAKTLLYYFMRKVSLYLTTLIFSLLTSEQATFADYEINQKAVPSFNVYLNSVTKITVGDTTISSDA